MAISKRRITLMAISLFAFVGLSQIVLESFVDARAGGGRSGGFRGSRSYQSPSRPSQPNPSQPRRDAAPPPQQPSPIGVAIRRLYAYLWHRHVGRVFGLHALFRSS